MEFKHPSSFNFSQLLQNPEDSSAGLENTPVITHGEILIKVSSRPSKSIWIDSETKYHKQLWVGTAIDKDAITLTSPSSTSGLDLSFFHIHTDSLSVIFGNDMPFKPNTPISIFAPTGSVKLPLSHQTFPSLSVDALETIVRSSSGSVRGDFTLRDALTILTSSGSIDINLALASSPSNATGSAVLDLKATSGSILVATTTLSTPNMIPKNKDYRSFLRTNSGSIRATLAHGSVTDLHSDSSSVHASLYPHGDASKRSDITTQGLSGSTDIVVYPSLANASTPLRNFYASYMGVSGSVRVQYPGQWEGRVEGSTVSGHIGVQWPGLKVVEDNNGWGTHSLKGVKGDGQGLLKFKGVSGSVELRGDAAPAVVEAAVREEEVKEEADEKTLAGDEKTLVDVGDGEDTETEVGSQVIMTPTSEDEGDEWKFIQ
ncbi:MAG: hypothetical protein Q9218_001059 [Villophora microphyllina]